MGPQRIGQEGGRGQTRSKWVPGHLPGSIRRSLSPRIDFSRSRGPKEAPGGRKRRKTSPKRWWATGPPKTAETWRKPQPNRKKPPRAGEKPPPGRLQTSPGRPPGRVFQRSPRRRCTATASLPGAKARRRSESGRVSSAWQGPVRGGARRRRRPPSDPPSTSREVFGGFRGSSKAPGGSPEAPRGPPSASCRPPSILPRSSILPRPRPRRRPPRSPPIPGDVVAVLPRSSGGPSSSACKTGVRKCSTSSPSENLHSLRYTRHRAPWHAEAFEGFRGFSGAFRRLSEVFGFFRGPSGVLEGPRRLPRGSQRSLEIFDVSSIFRRFFEIFIPSTRSPPRPLAR